MNYAVEMDTAGAFFAIYSPGRYWLADPNSEPMRFTSEVAHASWYRYSAALELLKQRRTRFHGRFFIVRVL